MFGRQLRADQVESTFPLETWLALRPANPGRDGGGRSAANVGGCNKQKVNGRATRMLKEEEMVGKKHFEGPK